MIAAWMGYAALIGVLAGLAGLALEQALRLNGRPARMVWAVAMGVTLVAPATMAWQGTQAVTGATHLEGIVVDGLATLLPLNTLVVTPTPFLQQLDTPLIWIWLMASLAAGLILAGGVARLRTLRRKWAHGTVDDTDVLVSDDFGPALVGLAHPQIVLPRWALELPGHQQALVIAHEAEHRDSRDTQLLAAGVFAAILTPWNLPLLWHLSRLRRAVELDCDARVIRRGVSPLRYGELLLQMGTQGSRSLPFAATLTEPRTLLERRIQMITRHQTQGRVRKTLTALALATTVIAVACDTPAPTQIADPVLDQAFVETEVAISPTPGAAADLPLDASVTTPGPLIIIDGVIARISVGEINALAVDIASIEVLKGDFAASLYGARAANGVIYITT